MMAASIGSHPGWRQLTCPNRNKQELEEGVPAGLMYIYRMGQTTSAIR